MNNLPELPTPPSGLLATGGVENISLSWNDDSENETGFNIERSSTGGGSGFNLVQGVSPGSTGFVDANLPPGSTYYYRVTATGLEGDSPPSDEATGTVLTRLEGWRFLNGLATDGGEDTSDGDLDGLPALIEFALFLDPNVSDTVGIPRGALVEENGETYLTLTFRRRSGGSLVDNTWEVDGIFYRVEVSTSLQPNEWEHGEGIVEWGGNPIDNGDGSETVRCRVRIESSDSRCFIRLAVRELE